MQKILIINGVNLNMQGKRESAIYGSTSFDVFFARLQQQYSQIHLDYFQSNIEGELVSKIQESNAYDAIIINPGAYTHTSIAIADALKSINSVIIEVHISNIYNRESFRHNSYIAACCKGRICGLGLDGYRLAIEHIIHNQNQI